MRKFFFLFFIGFIFSCQEVETVERPENLIPEDKMVDVLTELSLLNAAKTYNLKQLQNAGVKPTQYLYAKYDIDSLQFAKSNRYYAANIDTYKNIFEEVKQRLEDLKEHHDSIMEQEQQASGIDVRRGEAQPINRDSVLRARSRNMILERGGLVPQKDSD